MNEQEIETGERFLVDRVAFFLGKEGNWSPRVVVENCEPNYAILRLEEYTLHLFRDTRSDLSALPPPLEFAQRVSIRETGHLDSLCYVLSDEGAR